MAKGSKGTTVTLTGKDPAGKLGKILGAGSNPKGGKK
jgi:hypothetical protein